MKMTMSEFNSEKQFSKLKMHHQHSTCPLQMSYSDMLSQVSCGQHFRFTITKQENKREKLYGKFTWSCQGSYEMSLV